MIDLKGLGVVIRNEMEYKALIKEADRQGFKWRSGDSLCDFAPRKCRSLHFWPDMRVSFSPSISVDPKSVDFSEIFNVSATDKHNEMERLITRQDFGNAVLSCIRDEVENGSLEMIKDMGMVFVILERELFPE